MNGRKKLIAGGLVAGGLMLTAAGLVIGAGVAHADPEAAIYGGGYRGDHDSYSLWNELDEIGDGSITVETAGRLAAVTCQSLVAGESEGHIVASMVDADIDSGFARLAVAGAEFHFCPAYYN